MATRFEQAQDYLWKRQQGYQGRPITYNDGTTDYPIELAVPSEWKPDDLLTMGMAVDIRKRDYLISVSDLPVIPQQGHTITDQEVVCLVAPFGEEPCFRFTNHQRKVYRVHTSVVQSL